MYLVILKSHILMYQLVREYLKNADTDGCVRLSNNNYSSSSLDSTNTGADVYGFLTTTNNADIGGNLTCVA